MRTKWLLLALCGLFLLAAGCGGVGESAENEQIEEQEDAEQLYRLEDGVLYCGQEPVDTSITSLCLMDFEADSYEFLRAFEALTALELNGCNIEDLSVLKELSQMESLTLSRCPRISDISVIAALENLKVLQLSEVNISEISVLEGLDLTTLGLFFLPELEDITPIAGMVNLQTLEIWGTSVVNLSGLEQLVNLRNFSYGKSEKPDIAVEYSVLAHMTKLEQLNLTRAGTTDDLSALTNLTQMRVLSLPPMEDFNLQWVENMHDLEKLSIDVEDHPLDDLTPLENMDNLTRFSVRWMTAEQLEWIQETLPNCQVITDLYTGDES